MLAPELARLSSFVLGVTVMMMSWGEIFRLDFYPMPGFTLYLERSLEIGVILLLEVSPVSYFLFRSPDDMSESKKIPSGPLH